MKPWLKPIAGIYRGFIIPGFPLDGAGYTVGRAFIYIYIYIYVPGRGPWGGWCWGGWVVGWLGGWVVGWLGGWVVGWLGGWVVGWLGGWGVVRSWFRLGGLVWGWLRVGLRWVSGGFRVGLGFGLI